MAWLYYTTVVLAALIGVSFYTLYERKVLSISHLRVGPGVLSLGLIQPFADAIKLFTKEQFMPMGGNYIIYLLCPISVLGVAIGGWAISPVPMGLFNFKWLLIILLMLTSIGVYSHLGMGWASNSNYAMVGGLRCIAQSLSYEVSMAFLIVGTLIVITKIDLTEYLRSQELVGVGLMVPPLLAGWWCSVVSETNRSPFDFGEAESELVSGFNVEYGGGLFALVFIAEYSSMMLMSLITVVLFVGGVNPLKIWLSFGALLYLFVWMRVSFPRTRYDKLMSFSWLVVLPLGLICGGGLLII